MFVLPFHNYIGPGNPSDNGPPVDEDDCIAKVHDIKYDEAKTAEDVRKADKEAISRFRKSWRNGNWHSIIGDIGLSIKYLIESITGVLYPSISEQQSSNNCEILHIKSVLHLHCVFKNKPFLDKYESNLLAPSENLNYSKYDFVSQNKIDESILPQCVYIPLDWKELFEKYDTPLLWNNCSFCDHNFCDTGNTGFIDVETIIPIYNSSNRDIKYDIFNLAFWLKVPDYFRNERNYSFNQTSNNNYSELFDLELFKLQN